MKNARGYLILFGFFLAFWFGWDWVAHQIWPTLPPKEAVVIVKAKAAAEAGIIAGVPLAKQETAAMLLGGMAMAEFGPLRLEHFAKPSQEMITIVTGGLVASTAPVAELKLDGRPKAPEVAKVEPDDAKPAPKLGDLIAIGRGEKPFYLQALLNTRGGSVQQVVLTEFAESDREGLEVRKNDHPVPLHLVPGINVERVASVREQREIVKKLPTLQPGPYDLPTAVKLKMSPPSFLMFHYEKPGDERPLDTLGDREWTFVEAQSQLDPNADEQQIVFRTELDAPFFLQITKTYTLKRKDYHLGLKIDIKRLNGKQGPNQFRYQVTGANGLPIEGEWYTSSYRQAIVGFGDERGNTARYIEDSSSVRVTEGSDRQPRTNKLAIRYAAVVVQYFASALAVDDQQENRNFIEFVRATPVGASPPLRAKVPNKQPKDWEYWNFLDDLTVRAITETFDPADISHKYLLYHGPIKVRLLRQMPPEKAVDGDLVDRYVDRIHLDTLTDAPMPNFLGRFANAIYWTDIVIFFTNVVHSLLGTLHQVIPALAICVVVLTLIVRGLLFPMSRRQAHNGMVMQAKMAKLQPELRKLQEKYGADFQRMNQERIKLYKEHGVNPFAAMGGCFLLLLQMPVMMGLYYALQESVFFRLDHFLWIPNLAAPDMLIFWGEQIPFISAPNDLGSTLYLGPYFNALPIIAVGLMLYQQVKMMPKSDDPQVQSQQKMMKFMMIIFCFFFYKVAAGLCFYFITSTLWGIMERKFLPKPVKPEELEDHPAPGAKVAAAAAKQEEVERPLGWWGRKKRDWREKWHTILDEAQKQHEHRRDPAPPKSSDQDKLKKKKKKR